ncbi:MAG: hypothetical protein TREMPRED_000785 [Tremellales sp. Tagirdzhanova-0007]|nr:MAG: hypothetical protein TREMPRED_000785 [Tremellales sp. Tagirdzhanova-0007]
MMSYPSLLQYESHYPLYGISFSHSTHHPHRVALSTLVTGATNKLIIVEPSNPQQSSYDPSTDFQQLTQSNLAFPATKVGWEPQQSLAGASHEEGGGRGELLATTGDVLRIWELGKNWNGEERGWTNVGRNGWSHGVRDYVLSARSVLTNKSKSPQTGLPPITSFSWNPQSPNFIVTCSTDTTATLWDINTSQALTQLIAHDRAVFDLSWLPNSSDIFVSVGADGSLRAFDLRTLEHSTILYESSEDTPLARIAFSNREQHMLACFGLEDSKVLVLDMRSPGQPVAELIGHQAPLGAIAWGAGGDQTHSAGGYIASCGDDSQLLLYDLTQPLSPQTRPFSTRPTSRPRPPHADPSPNPYAALSPPATPAQNRKTPSPALAVEVLPVKAWTAETEVNNLAFSDLGDYVGCVSGQKLSVLRV